jgi:hypothetical protein
VANFRLKFGSFVFGDFDVVTLIEIYCSESSGVRIIIIVWGGGEGGVHQTNLTYHIF